MVAQLLLEQYISKLSCHLCSLKCLSSYYSFNYFHCQLALNTFPQHVFAASNHFWMTKDKKVKMKGKTKLARQLQSQLGKGKVIKWF